MEDYYNENQNKFEEFLRKVFYIEKYCSHRKNEEEETEKENDDNYNEKIEELNSLENNIKQNEDKIQVYEIQVSDCKNSKIALEKKFESISNSIKQINKKINIKEKENAELFIELNNLSNFLKEKKYDPSNKAEMNSILMKDAATNYDFENENINGNNNI
jgi:chromosome segregation ATPase